MRLAGVAATATVMAVVVVLLVLLLWSPRAVSADGAFSVQIPAGWNHFTGIRPDGSDSGLMTLDGPAADGVQPHLTVTHPLVGFVSLDRINQVWAANSPCRSRTTAASSPMTPTTVDGAQALMADCDSTAPNVRFEVVYVNHGHHTYVIGLTAAASDLERERSGALDTVLTSWRWN